MNRGDGNGTPVAFAFAMQIFLEWFNLSSLICQLLLHYKVYGFSASIDDEVCSFSFSILQACDLFRFDFLSFPFFLIEYHLPVCRYQCVFFFDCYRRWFRLLWKHTPSSSFSLQSVHLSVWPIREKERLSLANTRSLSWHTSVVRQSRASSYRPFSVKASTFTNNTITSNKMVCLCKKSIEWL